MLNTHETLASLFSDIADAIRSKTGDTADIVADNFPDAIGEIETGGGSGGDYNIEAVITGDTQVLNITDASGGRYPDEYVTTGMTAWYDAINNTRQGHNADATIWEDLSGNGYDLKPSLGDNPIIGNNFMYFYNGRLTSDSVPADDSEDYPEYAEIVVQFNDDPGSRFIAGLSKTGFGTFWVHVSTTSSLRADKSTPSSSNTTCNGIENGSDVLSQFSAYSMTAMLRNNNINRYINGSTGWGNTPRISVGAYTSLSQYVFKGYICAYRLYKRFLTEEERAQNFAQDVKRFGVTSKTCFTLDDLFNALPTLPTGTSKTITVSAAQKDAASAETIAIATNKGWVVA